MTSSTAFERTFGFARKDVALGNWREQPFNGWAFQNVSEMVPSARIAAREGNLEAAPVDLGGLLSETVELNGKSETVSAFLERSSTDALVVMKKGHFVGDWFAPRMKPEARHIIFSISKSLTAILAGGLEGEGKLDPNAPVTDYVPEAAGSVYASATVRHVLDMTVSLDFEEAYLDPESLFARYRRATMWNPGGGAESLREFIVSLQQLDEPHGQTFRYRSPNSDLLGIIVERASGVRYAELMSQKLWRPLGAKRDGFVTVDREGTARAAGGISVAARDLARVGEMMRQGGTSEGGRIVPQAWVEDTIHGGDAQAWQRGDMVNLFANGRYRNKWYQSGNSTNAYCGIGIHGQWLYVDQKAEVVIAKMSSQALPVDDPLDLDCVAFFEAICARV
ncbi:serine hydrolase domain-containing protein [Mesorhizobium sp. ANAO-SY3R2]|uniref:serine hydrolase domain-containing protein n=1 Tax=Mesorhizobium sp. ANAO-SY3R2 TaxID=3166644 RepID=UPI00366B1ADA